MSNTKKLTLIALLLILLGVGGCFWLGLFDGEQAPPNLTRRGSDQAPSLADVENKVQEISNSPAEREGGEGADSPESKHEKGEHADSPATDDASNSSPQLDQQFVTYRARFEVINAGKPAPALLGLIRRVFLPAGWRSRMYLQVRQDGLFESFPIEAPESRIGVLYYSVGDSETMHEFLMPKADEQGVVDIGTIKVDLATFRGDEGKHYFLSGRFTHASGYDLSKLAPRSFEVEVKLGDKTPDQWEYRDWNITLDHDGRFFISLEREFRHTTLQNLRESDIKKLTITPLIGGESLSFQHKTGDVFHFGEGVLGGGILEVECALKLQPPLVWWKDWDKGEETFPYQGLDGRADRSSFSLTAAGVSSKLEAQGRNSGHGVFRVALLLPCESLKVGYSLSLGDEYCNQITHEIQDPIELYQGELRRLRFQKEARQIGVAIVESDEPIEFPWFNLAAKFSARKELPYINLEVSRFETWRNTCSHKEERTDRAIFYRPTRNTTLFAAASRAYAPEWTLANANRITRLTLSKPWASADVEDESASPQASLSVYLDGAEDLPPQTKLRLVQLQDNEKREKATITIGARDEAIATFDDLRAGVRVSHQLFDLYGQGGFQNIDIVAPNSMTLKEGRNILRLKLVAERAFAPKDGSIIEGPFTIRVTCGGREVTLLRSSSPEIGEEVSGWTLSLFLHNEPSTTRTGTSSYYLELPVTAWVEVPQEVINRFGKAELRSANAVRTITQVEVAPAYAMLYWRRMNEIGLFVEFEGLNYCLWKVELDSEQQTAPKFDNIQLPTLLRPIGESGGATWTLTSKEDEKLSEEIDTSTIFPMPPGEYWLEARTAFMALPIKESITIPDQKVFDLELPSIEEYALDGEVIFTLDANSKKLLLGNDVRIGTADSLPTKAGFSRVRWAYILACVERDLKTQVSGDRLIIKGLPLNTAIYLKISIDSPLGPHYSHIPFQIEIKEAGAIVLPFPELKKFFAFPTLINLFLGQVDIGEFGEILEKARSDQNLLVEYRAEGKALQGGEGLEFGRDHEVCFFLKSESTTQPALTLPFTPQGDSIGVKAGYQEACRAFLKRFATSQKSSQD